MKDYNVYILEIKNKFTEDMIFKELSNLYRLFQRQCEKDERYKDINFIIGISNVDSKSAKISFIHNGKKGRPKKIIKGEPKDWHFHIYIISKRYNSCFCNQIKDILKRKKSYTIAIRRHNSFEIACIYVIKQSTKIFTYGDFNFKNAINILKKNVYNNRSI